MRLESGGVQAVMVSSQGSLRGEPQPQRVWWPGASMSVGRNVFTEHVQEKIFFLYGYP